VSPAEGLPVVLLVTVPVTDAALANMPETSMLNIIAALNFLNAFIFMTHPIPASELIEEQTIVRNYLPAASR
jgi:hypothetical protein